MTNLPILEAELKALWAAKRGLDVEVRTDIVPAGAASAVPTFLPVPTTASQSCGSENPEKLSGDRSLSGPFPEFTPFPQVLAEYTPTGEDEGADAEMEREERAAILEFDFGLSRSEAEAAATKWQAGLPRSSSR